MKKAIALLLAVLVFLSFAACGSKELEGTELTTENINEFLSYSAEVVDCNIEKDSGSVMGLSSTDYTGDADVVISVTNTSGANFQNVELTFKLYTWPDFLFMDGDKYGWEFSSGNEKNFSSADEIDRSSENSKTLKVSLPYEGNWEGTQTMKLVQYTSGIFSMYEPKESNCHCFIKLMSVSGSAVK